MRDFFGNDLKVGDEVAFCEPGYRNLITGKILNFTPQKVRVQYFAMDKRNTTYLSEPNFLVKKIPVSVRDLMGKDAW